VVVATCAANDDAAPAKVLNVVVAADFSVDSLAATTSIVAALLLMLQIRFKTY
jgi:hypothetical protein